MTRTISVARRYCGPPDSGNGGYTAGLIAAAIGARGPLEVTLKRPVPLDAPLHVAPDGEGATLLDAAGEIARAVPAALDLQTPAPPSPAEARAAAARAAPTIYQTCFVCGAERAPGDGLRVFTGPTADHACVAGLWTPDNQHTDDNGAVAAACLWGALDCPGYFGLMRPDLRALLGRMTAEVIAPPRPGETCIVTGWRVAEDGRKHTAGTAIHAAADGRLLAKAKTLWIALRA